LSVGDVSEWGYLPPMANEWLKNYGATRMLLIVLIVKEE